MTLKKIKVPKRKTKMGSGEIVSSMVEVQDTVEKLGVIECENGNVEVQWNIIKKKCGLDTVI